MVSATALRLRFRSPSKRGNGSSRRSEDGEEVQVEISDEHGDGIVGLRFEPAASNLARENKKAPAVIYSVIAGSPAAKAGLKPMDRITAINGKPVTCRATAVSLLSKANWPITVRAQRMDSIRDVTASPSERDMFDHLLLQIANSTDEAFTIGITMDTSDNADGAECKEPIVYAVVPRSPAAQAGLHAFDMLLAVNHTRVRSTQHALKLLKEASGTSICLAVGRPQALHNAALTVQRAWRRAAGVFRLVYTRSDAASPPAVTFNADITCAAVIASVPPDDLCHGVLRAQQALLFVNDKMCYNSVHAQQLLAHATGEVVLLYKPSKYIDVDLLRALSPDKPEARYSDGMRECPICMQQMAHPIQWVAGCGHQFCAECTKQCCSQFDTCPLCRATPKTISATPRLLHAPGSLH